MRYVVVTTANTRLPRAAFFAFTFGRFTYVWLPVSLLDVAVNTFRTQFVTVLVYYTVYGCS